MLRRFIALALMLVVSATSFGACKIRLIYGEKWSRSGRDIKKTMSSQEFKRLTSSKYLVELVDQETPGIPERNYTFKFPAIFVFDEQNRCFLVIDNVPYNASAKWIYGQIEKVNKRREEILKKIGTDTPEGCGQLLSALEKFVAGYRRSITGDFFYGDVYAKLKKLDPEDSTGWQWHFEFDKSGSKDGLLFVEKANEYREKKLFAEGDAYIEKLHRKPRKHLTMEQQQALLMAKFALHRENAAKKDEMINLLEKVSDIKEDTLWGTAALGWLKIFGKPALSTYWGWKRGDIPTGKFDVTVKFGVDYAFRRPGEYTVELIPDDGTPPPQIESITLKYKDEEIYTAKKPPFEFKIDKAYANRLTHMQIKGVSQRDTSGYFRIHRNVLRPRKEAK